ncbi:MAG: hypothetical protein V4772_12940 [Pseudomonadota bacterium]
MEIDQALGKRLLQVISAAASEEEGPDNSQPGSKILRTAINDPTVHTLVLALRLDKEPTASLLQVQRSTDSLAQWGGLSCI